MFKEFIHMLKNLTPGQINVLAIVISDMQKQLKGGNNATSKKKINN
mgnify:CR=1 FL=1